MTGKRKTALIAVLAAVLLLVAVGIRAASDGAAPADGAHLNGGVPQPSPAVTPGFVALVSPTLGLAPSPSPSPAPDPTPAPTSPPQDYVLNTNTKRFHYPDCASAAQILEKNREDVFASRDEILKQGYIPCGNCNP